MIYIVGDCDGCHDSVGVFIKSFLRNYALNIGIDVILLVGFELLSHHENQQSEQIAKMLLTQIEGYHRIHGIYPNGEKSDNDNKVIYKMMTPYDKTVKPYPKLYWREYKNPHCRHEFDCEKRVLAKLCRD